MSLLLAEWVKDEGIRLAHLVEERTRGNGQNAADLFDLVAVSQHHRDAIARAQSDLAARLDRGEAGDLVRGVCNHIMTSCRAWLGVANILRDALEKLPEGAVRGFGRTAAMVALQQVEADVVGWLASVETFAQAIAVPDLGSAAARLEEFERRYPPRAGARNVDEVIKELEAEADV